MTLQELKQELSKLNDADKKKDYIAKNVTYMELLDMFVQLISENTNTEKTTVTADVYDKLISLIEDNFRTPDGKGRGRKSIIDDDSLTFWVKVRKIKSGTTSTYIKQHMLAKLIERETARREENGIPVTDCIEHIMSAKLIEIDELEKKDKQLIQQVDDENTKIVNNIFSDGETN